MAVKTETLRAGTKFGFDGVGIAKAVGATVRRWGRRGQLGALATTEMGRITGGRC